MASMPSARGEGKDGNNGGERLRGHQAEGGEREATHSPSFLQQWTDHIFARGPTDWLTSSPCTGAACLSQVDDGREDVNVGGINTDANDQPSSYDVTDQQDAVDFSLMDHDESTADPSRDGTRSFDRDRSLSLDSTYKDDILSSGKEDVCEVDSPNHKTAASSPIPNREGVEVSTSECCPICLHAMSPYDLLYPMKCGVSTCSYNYCEECMSSLLRSSKEDYQEASDGSLRVKIQLKCPNCRADIAGIIEDVIRIRKDAFKADLELDSTPQAKSSEDSKPTSDESPGTSALQVYPFKNRSSASRQGHRKRIQELIETVESMPTPSSSRNQVLAIHGQQYHQQRRLSNQDRGSISSSSFDDNQSNSSSSSVDVRIDQPPSLFRSNHRALSTSIANVATSSSSPARNQTNAQPPSPKLLQLVTPTNLRRTQSMQTTPPRSMSVNKPSPRSVFDLDYYSFSGLSNTIDDSPPGKAKSKSTTSNTPPRLTKSRGICLEGISFADGGGFFDSAIDLGWCCHDNTAPATISKEGIDLHGGDVIDAPSSPSSPEGCGGYVDYSGIYHPCTEVEQDGGDQWDGPCQGCIFRQGMHMPDDEKVGEEDEELCYDSDPGQHFARSCSWKPPIISSYKDDILDVAERVSTSIESPATTRRRAKLRWRRRKSKRSKSQSKSDGSDSGSSQDISQGQADNVIPEDGLQHQRQEDQQAYLYDYFSRIDNGNVNAMRTGICSTNELEAGVYVQEALNSKWSLQWHVNITKSSKSSSQQRLPPKMCEVWIERGFRRNRTEIVEPKLMWREVSQPNLRNKRQLGGSTMRPYRVSLFAVRRIFQGESDAEFDKKTTALVDSPDLQGLKKQAFLPPMAKPNCLLLVRSSLGEDYTFEASCPEERDSIIHLLKIATARLVSHAVVGNGDLMIKEFFNEDAIEGGLYASLPSSDN